MTRTGFIIAVNAQGRKQRIPEHWMGHPLLGEGFRLPPSAKRRGTARPTPSTNEDIDTASTNADIPTDIEGDA